MRILMSATLTKKVLVVLDDMIADIMANRKFQVSNKELFIRCRKLNSFVCVYHSLSFLFQKMSDEIQHIILL